MASSGNTWQKKLIAKAKARRRSALGIKKPFAVDNPTPPIKKVREYRETIAVQVGRPNRRGFNGCKLSPAKRAIIEARKAGRAAFFKSIGVAV